MHRLGVLVYSIKKQSTLSLTVNYCINRIQMTNFQKCDQVSIGALSLSMILGVIAFLPGGLVPSSVLKGYLVIIFVLIAFVAWLIGRLIEGEFRIPWTRMLGAVGIFAVVLFFSSLFSHTPYLAFLGEGFDQGAFAVLGSLLLGLFLASTLFVTQKRIFNFLKVFFFVYIVLAVFQVIHLLFPVSTSLGVFGSNVSTPVGLLSDFALLSGAMVIGSAIILQFAKLERMRKILVTISGILGLFFVALANIFIVWVLVGLSAIVILVYTLVNNRFSENRSFPFLAFGLTLIALLFILANSLFGSALSNILHASYVDVHPSIQATTSTALQSIKHNPIFGAGPNSFAKEWLAYRPAGTNVNMLWDMPFSAGSSFLGTVAILGGALGIISAVILLLIFGYETFRKLFVTGEKKNGNEIFGLFLITVYFLLAIVFFAPGIAITTCAVMFIGIFFGALVGEGRIKERSFSFLKEPRAGFFSILAIVAFLLVSVGVVYATTVRFASIVYFEKSLASAQKNDIASASTRLSQAIALADMPTYERARLGLAEQAIQQILAAETGATPSDSTKANLQNAISIGNLAGRQAIALDSSDPANYIAFGDFLHMLIPLKIDGVAATATDAYQKAIALAPNYPKAYLNLATLYFDSGDNANARIYIQKALDQKENYTDAYFLLAQIEVAAGNTNIAIQKIQNATQLDPNNPDVYFELGLLEYNSGDYANAIGAFKNTVSLNNQYLNAWYYLALADQKTGNIKDATDILNALHKRLPDNQDVSDALAGKTLTTPTNAIPAPTTNPKEKSKKLPLPSSKN